MRLSVVCCAALASLISVASHAFEPERASLASVAQHRLPAPALTAAIAQARSSPLAFASGIDMGLDQADGSWDQP
ncbi:MAG TPA: hypothetical protein VLI06_13950, partial [Solimonas sp.]|nr:hypothetical protein [Solimonas sp.]